MTYQDLSINSKINCKGNARVLYSGYDKLGIINSEFPGACLILRRISNRDPGLFTPQMLLNKNTVRI